MTRDAVADAWDGLMTGVLGYPRYGAFGGDIGAAVTTWLGARHPDHVAGIHVIHPSAPESLDDLPRSLAERTYPDLRQWRGPTAGGHFIPIEEPELLARDLRDFFHDLRA
jgi:pimeloyl-ACP methyl ester carboxylesterase